MSKEIKTLNELTRFLARFKLEGPLPITFSIDEGTSLDDLLLRAHLTTQDRETGKRVKVHTVERLYEWKEDTVREQLLELVRRLYIHESQEWLRFDGELVNDPHAGEK